MPALAKAPQVNMHEAKTNLSRIAADIESGRVPFYIIARHGDPVLKVVRYEDDAPKRKRIGVAEGKFECPDDDFFYNDDIVELFKDYL